MINRGKLAVVVSAIAALSFVAPGLVPHAQAEGGPTITIDNKGTGDKPYSFSPAQLDAKAGQAITVTNNDPNGVHSVTAQDRSFSVDVPPSSSVTLKVDKPGKYDYICQYHSDAHNPASLNIS
jgi:plastocyanin